MVVILKKPANALFPNPGNLRKQPPEKELRELGESVKKKQFVALIVRKNGMIVDGNRRFLGGQMAGVEFFDVVEIDDDTTDAEINEIALITAMHRADLTPYETWCGFMAWLKLHVDATAKELAEAVSRSEATVSTYLSLSKCIPTVQDAAAKGLIGLKDWNAISMMPEAEQPALLAAKLGGASAAQLKRIRKKPDENAVRVPRGRYELGSGVVVTLAGVGQGLTLDDVIESLSELLKEAKKANDQGLDSKTFSAALKCRTSKGVA